MTTATAADIAHLLRRTGYGGTPAEIDAAVTLGWDGAVEAVLDRSTPDPGADAVARPALPVIPYAQVETVEERRARSQARRAQRIAIAHWWINRMVHAQRPFREKLTWIWHDHFATSIDKVNSAALMAGQNDTLRSLAGGSFEALVQAVAKDPAMMIWLDTNQSRRGQPNENFARELMELFTLGIGNYTDADVREAARAFTGWRVDRDTGTFREVPAQSDTGVKTVLGVALPFSGEQLVSLLARHPATARFVTAKLWSALAHPISPGDPLLEPIAAAFAADLDITGCCRRILLHPQFRSPQARQGLVKEPVEYVAGVLRALGIDAGTLELAKPSLFTLLGQLGQVPFDPPSVGGWPQNGYFVSTATALARLRFAQVAVAAADVAWLGALAPEARSGELARRLGVTGWTAATLAALSQSAANPRLALTLALVSPEYVLA